MARTTAHNYVLKPVFTGTTSWARMARINPQPSGY
jgi:hypothetical protein